MVWKSKIIFVLLVLSACSGRPHHEKFPGGQGRQTDVIAAATQRAVLGGFDPNNNPLAGRPHENAPAQGAAGPTISGRIELAAGVSTEGKTLFIFAKSPFGGPPLAVKRIVDPKFPFLFSLSSADKMAPQTVFEGEVNLHARLDTDGNAMTTDAGDYVAEVPTKVGKQGIVLQLKLNP
jgi:hypothetical protein